MTHTIFDEYKKITYCDKTEKFLAPRCTENCRFLYLFYNRNTRLVKIGITNNVHNRIRKIICESGSDIRELIVMSFIEGHDESPSHVESFLHSFFKNKRKVGEWFDLSIKDVLYVRDLLYDIYGEDIWDHTEQYRLDGQLKELINA